jgi:endonuclease/exonuclease/phosphatase family metal-dependent hydrolase
MSEIQNLHEPVGTKFRWRATAIKTAILLAALVIWQGLIKRPTAPAFGISLHPISNPIVPSGDVLRVATFNIAGGVSPTDNRFDLDRTAKYLHNYDLIGLQEVHGAAVMDWRDQAKILGQTLRMPWLFAPSERRWWHDYFGNGLLCDLPVTSWQRLPLSTSISESNRSMLRAIVIWHGHPLWVINTHLDRHADHDIELCAVIAAFYDSPTPSILLGDLNIDADPTDQQLNQVRHDPTVTDALGIGMGDKLHASNDWIFARGLSCVAAGMADDDASDHKVIWADLK